MSWIQKLCDVYDDVIETTAADGDGALLPVGFLRKPIKYNIILSPQGEFVTAQVIPDEEQLCPIPSTPAAEGRTGENGTPFPLADQLKYLLCEDGVENPRFENYLQQLADWCAEPDAPACLRVLHSYLAQRTLYADLLGVPGLKLKYHKDENAHDAKGADAKAIACFSIQSASEENRLWMRTDVRESWTRRLAASGGQRALCYAKPPEAQRQRKAHLRQGRRLSVSIPRPLHGGAQRRDRQRLCVRQSAQCTALAAQPSGLLTLRHEHCLLEHGGPRTGHQCTLSG